MVMFFFQSISVYVLFHASFFLYLAQTAQTHLCVSLSLPARPLPSPSAGVPGGGGEAGPDVIVGRLWLFHKNKLCVPHISSRALTEKQVNTSGRRHLGAQSLSALTNTWNCRCRSIGLMYLNVEGPGAGDDLKQVVSQQEIPDGQTQRKPSDCYHSSWREMVCCRSTICLLIFISVFDLKSNWFFLCMLTSRDNKAHISWWMKYFVVSINPARSSSCYHEKTKNAVSSKCLSEISRTVPDCKDGVLTTAATGSSWERLTEGLLLINASDGVQSFFSAYSHIKSQNNKTN